jgi:general transcriptional corepressor TUP1
MQSLPRSPPSQEIVPRSGSPEFPGSLSPRSLPANLRKEGPDWFAMYNPHIPKKTLDVDLLHQFNHESVVCCVRFSKDGKFLATGCNRTAQIFDMKTGSMVCQLSDDKAVMEGDLYIRSVCFSPDGKFLATGAEDRQIRVSNADRHEKVSHAHSSNYRFGISPKSVFATSSRGMNKKSTHSTFLPLGI